MTSVTGELMNNVLRNVLRLIHNNIGTCDAPWMNRIACMYSEENVDTLLYFLI